MNNRELATVIWAGIALVWVLTQRDIRLALAAFMSGFVRSRVLVAFLAMTAYMAAVVYAGSLVGVWDTYLTSDTIAWSLATGLSLFGKSVSIFRSEGSLKRLALAAVGLTVLVEVFVNLYVFPLVIELGLIPLLVVLAAVSVVAERDHRYAPAKKLTDGLLAGIGLGLVLYVATRVAADSDTIHQLHGLQRIGLPVWLTLSALPFIAGLGLWSSYERAFSMIRWATDDRRRLWRARLALLTGFHLRARDIGAFNGIWCKKLASATSSGEAKAVLRSFRLHRAAEVGSQA